MGLAGRRQRQRIPADPRNLSWADDASRFGLSYLSKLGWDASQGLGSSGDGIKTHLKVQQKLDMMGIGAQHQRDPNGIAWKQNKDFEALLKRLNESVEQERDGKAESGNEHEAEIPRDESSARKRNHKDMDDPDTSNSAKKKRKKDKEKHQESCSVVSAVPTVSPNADASSSDSRTEPIPKPRPMAHRARIRAAKRIADKSASAISEILGIAPSSSLSTSTSSPPSDSQSSSLSIDNLTTSTKSVADYFKEKLTARSHLPTSASVTPSGFATPGLGTTRLPPASPKNSPLDDEVEPPRRGIGCHAPAMLTSLQVPESVSTLASRARDANADVLRDKLRRKAERKVEKQKRREVRASQSIPENLPASLEDHKVEGDAESVSNVLKKMKIKRQVSFAFDPPPNTNDKGTKKSHERGTPSGSSSELNKKSKREHKRK